MKRKFANKSQEVMCGLYQRNEAPRNAPTMFCYLFVLESGKYEIDTENVFFTLCSRVIICMRE